MGDHHEERPSDDWANMVGKWTFLLTVILTVLYVASVVYFIR